MPRAALRLTAAALFAIAATAPALPAFAAADAPAAAAAPAAAMQPRLKMMFWALDRNGDGYIDLAEVKAYRTAKFQSLDANGDGVLTKDEVAASRPMWGKGGKGGNDADRSARREKRLERTLKWLGFPDGADSVTLAEFVAYVPPIFTKADTDKDGKVSLAEFEAAAASMRHGLKQQP